MGVPPQLGKVLMDIRRDKGEGEMKECLGLLWDRDTVAFYGDPAWEARLAPRDLPYDCKLAVRGNVYTLLLHAQNDCRPALPPSMLLPHRIQNIELMEGQSMQPLVTDNFLMIMQPGDLKKGKTYRVVFKAKRIVN
jgi:zinc protease